MRCSEQQLWACLLGVCVEALLSWWWRASDCEPQHAQRRAVRDTYRAGNADPNKVRVLREAAKECAGLPYTHMEWRDAGGVPGDWRSVPHGEFMELISRSRPFRVWL